jgi:hypothetical protein
MSLNSLSLGSWDFFGVGTRGDGRDVDREEESIGENLPMEGIYQQVFEEVHGRGHPAIHPWSHSMQDNHTDLNSTPNDYRPPLASYVSHTSYPNLWDTQDGPSYINQFPIDDVQFSVGSSQTSNPNSEILLRQLSPVLDGADIGNPREHPLYLRATTGPDGLYHCPWEADSSCNHKPEKLKCNYE